MNNLGILEEFSKAMSFLLVVVVSAIDEFNRQKAVFCCGTINND